MPAGLTEKQAATWMRPGAMAWAGPLVCLAGLVGVMSPRSMAFWLPLLLLAAIVPSLAFSKLAFSKLAFSRSGQTRATLPAAGLLQRLGAAERRALAALALFALWALASTLWSSDRGHSLGKSLYLLLVLACFAGFSAWRGRAAPAVLQRIGIGLLCAVAATSLVMALDVWTNQGLVRWLLVTFPGLRGESTKHILTSNGVITGLTENEINRRTAVLTLLLWPATLIAVDLWRARLRAQPLLAPSLPGKLLRIGFLPAVAAVLGAAGLAIALGGHQSSQTAIVAGIATFVLASFLPRTAVVAAIATWALLVLLIVPIVMGAHGKGLHEAPWLFHSARHRVVIWNRTVERIALKPWVGIGADATPAAKEFADDLKTKDGQFPVSTGRHAHNAYLQVWYELGGIGALLLLVAGLALLAAIAVLPAYLLPWALAQAATSAIMAASSFSMWQVWFLASIGAGAAAGMLAGTISGNHRRLQ